MQIRMGRRLAAREIIFPRAKQRGFRQWRRSRRRTREDDYNYYYNFGVVVHRIRDGSPAFGVVVNKQHDNIRRASTSDRPYDVVRDCMPTIVCDGDANAVAISKTGSVRRRRRTESHAHHDVCSVLVAYGGGWRRSRDEEKQHVRKTCIQKNARRGRISSIRPLNYVRVRRSACGIVVSSRIVRERRKYISRVKQNRNRREQQRLRVR